MLEKVKAKQMSTLISRLTPRLRSRRKINIIPCSPVVYHYDFRNFEKFLDKFKFVGFEGSKHLKQVNLKSSLENNYIKLENNFSVRLLITKRNSRFGIYLKFYTSRSQTFFRFEISGKNG